MKVSKTILCIICLVVSIATIACSTEIQPSDLKGTWYSPDGAELQINENGEFNLKNFQPSTLFSTINFDNRIDINGIWKLEKVGLYYEIELINSERTIPIVGITLLIKGKGLLNNTGVEYLYTYIGDPDDLNEYVFKRK